MTFLYFEPDFLGRGASYIFLLDLSWTPAIFNGHFFSSVIWSFR